jgi:ABC-2 type transport system ATP-binding protein
MTNVLEVRNVVKEFANHRALDDVSIGVPGQSIFGLLGPNGAGKTTLIRIINQITAPDTGQVLLKGQPLNQNHISQIGYLPEERGLYKKMKVGEQALYLAQLKGLSKKEAQQRLMVWFKKFEILSWWNRKVEELSKGMQQKVQFIVTVVHNPELLIFDEPFSGFDPINVNLLKDEILDLKKTEQRLSSRPTIWHR